MFKTKNYTLFTLSETIFLYILIIIGHNLWMLFISFLHQKCWFCHCYKLLLFQILIFLLMFLTHFVLYSLLWYIILFYFFSNNNYFLWTLFNQYILRSTTRPAKLSASDCYKDGLLIFKNWTLNYCVQLYQTGS